MEANEDRGGTVPRRFQRPCRRANPQKKIMLSELRATGADMAAKILAVVDDIFFLAKIQQTAHQLGIAVEVAAPDGLQGRVTSEGPSVILLDLNHRSGRSIEVLQGLKSDPATRAIPVISFLSHVQADLATAARAAGCDRVLARSAFSQQLPQLLREWSREENHDQ